MLLRALAASALIHLTVLVLLCRHSTQTKREPARLAVEYIDAKPFARAKTTGYGSRNGRAPKLKMSWNPLDLNARGELGKRQSRDLTQEGELGLDENEWGARGGNFKEIENFRQYDQVRDLIRGLFNYPYRLAEHEISGSVNVRLVFDQNSNCDWSASKFSGGHPYLQVYILALIKKFCGLENVTHLHFKERQFVDLSFNFVLTRQHEDDRDQIVGNVLSFKRIRVHSPLEYNIGPIHGFFLAPAATLDVGWIKEHWEKWVEGKDPLREFQNQ